MATQVVMPQMGESIAEGTIVRWIKKVGDSVDRDEPLFEISTDKVDAEIPAPAAGVLTEIKVQAGETVAVNEVVATIGEAFEIAQLPGVSKASEAANATAAAQPQADGAGPAQKKVPTTPKPNGPEAAAYTPSPSASLSHDEVRRQKSSPLVRRIAKEHKVDVSQIHGSGLGGRVTKHDILEFIESPKPESRAQRPEPRAQSPQPDAKSQEPQAQGPEPRAQSPEPRVPAYREGDRVEIEPLSVMRKKIAEHMVMSRRTSAHVHSVFHVNFSTVARIREQKKAEYEQSGTKLTYMAFIAKAVIAALRRFPIVNASLDGDNIVYKKDINLGIAVSLDAGLIVPVIKHADEKNLLGLSRSIADLAERARAKQLKPDEVHGGTFTITNPGQFGSQFGMPIINQPQLAILGVGTIEKRAVVVDDAIAIRTMAYLTLGYDHRLIDGATGDQFMAEVKQQIENFDLKSA
ncbi:MAG TPA: dihydrolipoamide acetyltransferase family protein [Vicinamibacterales bacterium]|nr:dihydrolipoamide acetyltransferase family protein [Vicinamibacterales bacterium]